MEAYCVKCKEKVTQKSPKPFVTERGMKMSMGKCPHCGTKTCVAVKSVGTAASLKRNSSPEVHRMNLSRAEEFSKRNIEERSPIANIERSFVAGFKAAEKLGISGKHLGTFELDILARQHAAWTLRLDKPQMRKTGIGEPVWLIEKKDSSWDDEEVFYSKERGWVGLMESDRFTGDEKKKMRKADFPIGGVWLEI